jgi:tetratricopeptide (TPR) repeat protein
VHAMRYTFTSDPADIARARELAEQALAIDPDTHAARQWLVYVLMRQHRPDEAMRETDIIMQRASDPHMACYFAACCLAAEARYEDALRYYQTSLRINPSRSWSWFGAGNCHARLGRLENARWCLQRAIEAESSGSHFTTAGCGAFLAELLRGEGEYDKAWAIAKQAQQTVEASDFIYRDSFRALALISLGRIALDRHQTRTAETAFHQAELGIRGRPRALGAGHLLIQAMAGKAAARHDSDLLQQAAAILNDQGSLNFDWLWGCHKEDTQQALAQAGQLLAKPNQL